MMRVMVAVALPALASSDTCSQAVCCTGITGMCKGNADTNYDITCPDSTINVGGTGTSIGVCCEDACLAAVCAADGVVPKDGFEEIVGTTEAACCDAVVTGMCSGNTDAATDYDCGTAPQMPIAASASTTGDSEAACCEGRCLASACGGAGFTNTKEGFEESSAPPKRNAATRT
jgi:hypothetical protein